MKLHLLDGTYELFRAYYGVDPSRAPDGREVGAVGGLVGTTLSLLREPDVTHLAVATDHVIRSFRNDLWPGYKTEEGVPEDLLAQFPLAERALEAIGVVVWPMIELEADDALAKFGVSPASIPDWLALVGDAADGYPGLPGWGAKTASAVLARWEHLEAIPADPLAWEVKVRGSDRLAATLRERMKEALLFRRLATLRRDAPLPETLEDLRWRGVPRERWLALCEELGFERTRDRPHRWA
ncbi:MAG: flap endonuclease [Gemmatimonadetes bacterium]|nr:MAG: flap endonuclease [Gemmatimonadota bacterium]